ncbi:isoprenoid synthase domain-containing protein [Lophiotrema nucula]|uniref:Terpene synthase n=1 Tax=Lophiotrema nucula TaxID=690887 RepID=A0A6A5YX74_9PLEO|nr:isoprenoid synthase domain-containing protein [Lophiotrema nucula]
MLSLLTHILTRIVHLLFKFVIGFDLATSQAISQSQSPSNTKPRQTREELLNNLRGKTVRIPDLTSFFAHWPDPVNSDLDKLRKEIDEWLKPFDLSPKVLAALQKADFGYFGATWWPHARFERLKIVTYLIIWLFIWDDEIDISDGSMYEDFSNAQLYREQTLAFARYSLGFDNEEPEVENKIIRAFAPIGLALNDVYDTPHREMVYRELEFDITMAEKEQRLRLSQQVPTLEEFWQYRLGASAVYLCLVFQEFSRESTQFPMSFYEDEDVKLILLCTNRLISAVNDLLSLKKEIRKGAVDSLVPILCYHGREAQGAVDEVITMIKDDVRKLDEAAARLLTKYEDDEQMKSDVGNFINGCKSNAVGNLTWSLVTGRYGVSQAKNASGGLLIDL